MVDEADGLPTRVSVTGFRGDLWWANGNYALGNIVLNHETLARGYAHEKDSVQCCGCCGGICVCCNYHPRLRLEPSVGGGGNWQLGFHTWSSTLKLPPAVQLGPAQPSPIGYWSHGLRVEDISPHETFVDALGACLKWVLCCR